MPDKLPLFHATDLTCRFGHGREEFNAVDGISFEVRDEEIISIVGESGSGKTTLARMMLHLQPITSGTLLFEGKRVTEPREHWRKVQAVFQDPFASFNQFFTIKAQLHDCFHLFDEKPGKEEMRRRIDDALRQVNIEPSEMDGKYPFELSGGQMQRMLLARIFLIRPRVLLADEPTSMIDACSRAGILDMLLDLKRKLKMTIVFITHDIGLAYYVSDRVFIMCRGRIVEQGPPKEVILKPQHDYTRKLLDDIPVLHRDWL